MPLVQDPESGQGAIAGAILQHLPSPVVAVDRDGQVIEISQAAAALFGYDRAELLNGPLSVLIAPDMRDRHAHYLNAFAGSSENHITMGRRGTIAGYHKDGSLVPLAASISKFERSSGLVLVATLRDMRMGRLAELELEWRATHDTLTGLPNRTLILERLGDAISKAARSNTPVGLLFVDLDGFKLVNDAYGHAAGDELLRAIGARLKNVVRPGDMVGRLSGDEFVIVCEAFAAPAEISSVADRILDALASSFQLQAGEIFQNCSIGIALCGAGETPEQVIANADSAVHSAKQKGRSNWKVFNPGLDQQARRRLRLATGLRTAIARNELHTVYQPIVDSAQGATCGFELLLRWRPPGQEISPAEFIGIAERIGAIIPIGEWAFVKACQMRSRLVRVYGARAPYVSVNLSVRQLHEADLALQFDLIAEREGADRAGILIEITESILMTDLSSAVDIINDLSRRGFQIVIDDFGTGYSSLAQILRFPVNVIKVDRELVRNLLSDPGSRTITRAIRNIALETGKKLILEGIEEEDQRAMVEEMGCSTMQGFLYSRPLAEADTAAFLERYPPQGGAK